MNYSPYPSFTPKEVKTSGAAPRTLWEPDPSAKKIWLTYAALAQHELDFDLLRAAGKRWGANRGGLLE